MKSVPPRRPGNLVGRRVLLLVLGALAIGCFRPNPEFGDDDRNDARPDPPDAAGIQADVASPADLPDLGLDRDSTEAARADGTDVPITADTAADRAPDAVVVPPTIAGNVLHWAFEETGLTAVDSSGSGFNGRFVGAEEVALPSTNVPALQFPNAFSRAFVLEAEQRATLDPLPATLKRANDLTISVWYRATRIDAVPPNLHSELVSLGDNLVLRVWADRVEFGKQTSAGGGTFARCFGNVAGGALLNGAWHHVAAATSSQGMNVYLDGVRICSNTAGEAVFYTEGNVLTVGRHANQIRGRFDGNLDEIRIYARALTAAEIAKLAAGGH